jgi:hypothetical protein
VGAAKVVGLASFLDAPLHTGRLPRKSSARQRAKRWSK